LEIAARGLENAELGGRNDNLGTATLLAYRAAPQVAAVAAVVRTENLSQDLASCADQQLQVSLIASHIRRPDTIKRPTEEAKGGSWRSEDAATPEQFKPLLIDCQPVCPTRKQRLTDCQCPLVTKLQPASEIGTRLHNQVAYLGSQMDALKHNIDTIAAEIQWQRTMLLGRVAAYKDHVALARHLWKCGTQPPFRLANLHQMLMFLGDMRAARSPRESCGSTAHEAFLSHTDGEKNALYDKADALIEQARRCGISNLFDATMSLDEIGQLAIGLVHPMKGRFAACVAQVGASLRNALEAARAWDDGDDDDYLVYNLADAIKLLDLANSVAGRP